MQWRAREYNNKIGVIIPNQDPLGEPVIEVPSPQSALPLTAIVIGIAAVAVAVAVILLSRKRQ